MFNAMTFKDVKSFMLVLLKELQSRLSGAEKKVLSRNDFSDEELAKKIAKTLKQLSAKSSANVLMHTIIVIDEVD